MTRHNDIRAHLDYAIKLGVLDSYQSQSLMPGKRWSLYGHLVNGNFTTREVELVIEGMLAVVQWFISNNPKDEWWPKTSTPT